MARNKIIFIIFLIISINFAYSAFVTTSVNPTSEETNPALPTSITSTSTTYTPSPDPTTLSSITSTSTTYTPSPDPTTSTSLTSTSTTYTPSPNPTTSSSIISTSTTYTPSPIPTTSTSISITSTTFTPSPDPTTFSSLTSTSTTYTPSPNPTTTSSSSSSSSTTTTTGTGIPTTLSTSLPTSTLTTGTTSIPTTLTTSLPTSTIGTTILPTTATTSLPTSTLTTGGITTLISTTTTGGVTTSTPTPIPISPKSITISKTIILTDQSQVITFESDQSFKFTDYTLLSITISGGASEIQFAVSPNNMYSVNSTIIIPSNYLASKSLTLKLKIGNIISSIEIPFTIYVYTIDSSTASQIGSSLKLNGQNLDILNNNLIQVKTSTNKVLRILSSNSTTLMFSLNGVPGDFDGNFYVFYDGFEIFNRFLQMNVFIDGYTPKYIDTQTTVTIYGSFFVNSSNSLVSLQSSRGVTFLINFNYVDANTINIPATNFKDLIHGLMTMTYTHNTSFSGVSTSVSNSIPMTFLQPEIDSMTYNKATGELVVSGIFLPSTYFFTYLNGIVSSPVAPTQSSESGLVFSNPKMVYGTPYFSCSNVNSNPFTSFASIYLKPVLNFMDRVPKRNDKLIYYSGSFLSNLNQTGQAIYQVYIYNNVTGQSIPCIDIKEVGFNPIGQLYNMSCSVSDYLIGANNLIIKLLDQPTVNIESSISFIYAPPTIESVSSTFYGVPDQLVTVSGNSFCKTINNITIGGEICQDITSVSVDINKVTCKFSSNVGNGYSETSLPVSIACENQSFTGDMFLYKRNDPCPSFNGTICSGPNNGVCNSITRKCECLVGFAGFDCSTIILVDVPIPVPTIKNAVTTIDVSSTTKSSLMAKIDSSSSTASSSLPVRFDIGIIQIREIDTYNSNKVIRFVDLKNVDWNLTSSSTDSSDSSTYNYKSMINSDDGTYISIQITVNSNQQTQHDFLGDSIDILPNSVKYQVEVDSWKFSTSLTSIQLLFESKITNTECENQQPSQNIQLYGSSIRTIETKTITGQTLAGTFSNRMIVDNRVIVSTIQILNEQDLISSNIQSNNQTTTIQAITIPNSKIAIVDPNFGVLLSNDQSITKDGNNLCQTGNNNTKPPLANWKIAVAVVCSVVGLSLIILTSVLLYGKFKNRSYVYSIRLKFRSRK